MVFRFEVIVLFRVRGNVLLALGPVYCSEVAKLKGQCGCFSHL